MGWNSLSIPKHQRCNWSLWMDKSFYPTVYNGYDYLSMSGLKLNLVSKSGHWSTVVRCTFWCWWHWIRNGICSVIRVINIQNISFSQTFHCCFHSSNLKLSSNNQIYQLRWNIQTNQAFFNQQHSTTRVVSQMSVIWFRCKCVKHQAIHRQVPGDITYNCSIVRPQCLGN